MKEVLKIKLWKTITYRILSSAMSFCILYYTTGTVKLSALLTAVELLWKPLLYYFHEKLWLQTEKKTIRAEKIVPYITSKRLPILKTIFSRNQVLQD